MRELLSRARLLQAMAEDDLSSKERQARGAQEAEAAYKITAELYQRFPDQPDVLLAHAKSEYWLGQVRYADQSIAAPERRAQAKPRWLEYRKLTADLAARQNAKAEWLVEASYAEGNLCAVELSEPKRPEIAIKHCDAATQALSRARTLNPDDLDIGLNLAMAYAWQADANAALKNWTSAIARREDQSRLVGELEKRFPRDQRVTEARLLADFGFARLFADINRKQEARAKLSQAEATANQLRSHDPDNGDWSSWLKQIAKLRDQLS
jgi:hypothetical protein